MELGAVMRTVGSTRQRRPDPVSDDIIFRILDNARFAPSGGNRQGWRVIMVRDAGTRASRRGLFVGRKNWQEFHAPLFTASGRRPSA